MSKYWNISSPITVHVEVTEACNERCRHCYNFSRLSNHNPKTISFNDLYSTIDELVVCGVMHVIITGGEPLLALDKVVELARECNDNGITVSLNSNLLAATDRNMTLLREASIDHILTTLHSFREEVHDYVSTTNGAFRKIVNGIGIAQRNGIRVSVNTILSHHNKHDIYNTGRFVRDLGVTNFLANRTIPSPTNDGSSKTDFRVGPSEAQMMFDDLLRIREDCKINVGTCRTVPQCFFSDLDKYDVFLARGCAAGKKHLSLGVNGDAHACVHEEKTYGNVHIDGLKKIWEEKGRPF